MFQTKELAHIRTTISVNVVVVVARETCIPVTIIARNVPMVELELGRSADSAEQALNSTLRIEEVVHIPLSMMLPELLLVNRQRANKLRRGHRGADREEESAVDRVVDVIGCEHRAIVWAAADGRAVAKTRNLAGKTAEA